MIKSLNKYCNSFPSTYDSVRVGCPTLLKCKKTDNNCTTLFTDLFLYSYETDFIHWLHFHFPLYRCSPFTNNSKFGDFVDAYFPLSLE